MSNKSMLQVRIPKDLLNAIDDVAARHNMNRSQFAISALSIGMLLEPKIMDITKSLSPNERISSPEILNCIAARRLAEIVAQKETFGESTLEELLHDESGHVIKFEKLFEFFKRKYTGKYERKIMLSALEKESNEVALNDVERRILINKRIGQAWIQSDEYKSEIHLKSVVDDAIATGKIEVEFEIEDIDTYRLVFDLLNMVDTSEISPETAQKQINALGISRKMGIKL